MQVLRDPQYGVALVAAPFLWASLLVFWPGTPEPTWPALEPTRFLLIALVYPVLEEMTFRGLLQGTLLQHHWGRVRHAGLSAANWVTSALFAASHLIWHDALHAAAIFAPALVFGHFRDRYGRTTPSILLHMFYNTGFALLFVNAVR